MGDIHPYVNLAPDPLHEAAVCWIDDREGADGSQQTLDYDGRSVDITGEAVPESDYYVYRSVVTGLTADTHYSGTIDNEQSVEWTTLPDSLGEISILVTSDLHITDQNDQVMTEASDMQALADKEPDIMLIAGDLVDLGDTWDEFRAESYLDWFANYWQHMRDSSSPQLAMVPGNHDVGNHYWTGNPETETVDPEWWIQYFFEYPQYSNPVGENYGSWELGDYLQILGIDTHSAFPVDVGDWLSGTIDATKTWCLPFQHSPLLGCGDRDETDIELQERLRNAYSRKLLEAPNVFAFYCGHIHTRSRTVAWTLPEFPEDKETIPFDDGNGLIQFGEGYAAGRPLNNEWYVDYNYQEEQFYTFEFTEKAMTVREYDTNGVEYSESPTTFNVSDGGDWMLDKRFIANIGDADLGRVDLGGGA